MIRSGSPDRRARHSRHGRRGLQGRDGGLNQRRLPAGDGRDIDADPRAHADDTDTGHRHSRRSQRPPPRPRRLRRRPPPLLQLAPQPPLRRQRRDADTLADGALALDPGAFASPTPTPSITNTHHYSKAITPRQHRRRSRPRDRVRGPGPPDPRLPPRGDGRLVAHYADRYEHRCQSSHWPNRHPNVWRADGRCCSDLPRPGARSRDARHRVRCDRVSPLAHEYFHSCNALSDSAGLDGG